MPTNKHLKSSCFFDFLNICEFLLFVRFLVSIWHYEEKNAKQATIFLSFCLEQCIFIVYPNKNHCRYDLWSSPNSIVLTLAIQTFYGFWEKIVSLFCRYIDILVIYWVLDWIMCNFRSGIGPERTSRIICQDVQWFQRILDCIVIKM